MNDERDNMDDTAATAEQEPATDTDAGSAGLIAAERQRDEYKDLLLRKTAEFENYRKRTDRERSTMFETAAAGILEELLPLVDDLERALGSDPGADGSDA